MHATTPLKIDGRWVCRDCRVPVPSQYGGRNVRPGVRCEPCARKRYRIMAAIRGPAALAVAQARRRGDLAPPAEVNCTDCGAQAEHYDHRDYTQSLKVEPVCRKCNYRRGYALVWGHGFHPDATPQGAQQ